MIFFVSKYFVFEQFQDIRSFESSCSLSTKRFLRCFVKENIAVKTKQSDEKLSRCKSQSSAR